jgi:hypothetical protein
MNGELLMQMYSSPGKSPYHAALGACESLRERARGRWGRDMLDVARPLIAPRKLTIQENP